MIGAGPAGCGAAFEAHRQGDDVVLFEAEGVVGGRTATWRTGEFAVDSGAGFFTNFYPELQRLLELLGMTGEIVPLPRRAIMVHDGVRAPLSSDQPATFFGLPFIGAKSKARITAATAWRTVRHRGLDLADPASLAKLDDRSVAEDARTSMGEEAYQFLVRPSIEPFWYVSPEDISRSLMIALQVKAAGASFFSLAGGMDSVCNAISERVDTQTSTTVRDVRVDGGAMVVALSAGGEEAFDRVVIATPADVASKLTASLGSMVTPALRAFLNDQQYVPNAHASFLVDRELCPQGASTVFACGPGSHEVAAVSFSSHKGQNPNLVAEAELVSVFLSAAASAELVGASDAVIFERCWHAARSLWPEFPERTVPHACIARSRAIPVHAVGRFRRAAALPAPAGPLRFAGDFLTIATVDGALRSGRLAVA